MCDQIDKLIDYIYSFMAFADKTMICRLIGILRLYFFKFLNIFSNNCEKRRKDCNNFNQKKKKL